MNDPKILEEALNIVAGSSKCERYTNDHKCRDDNDKLRVSVYSAYGWCNSCIAMDALERYSPEKYK